MATVMTDEKALAIALKKAGKGADAAAVIAALPDNCKLITDVVAFRTVLQGALDSSVADLGPKVDAQVLPKKLRVLIGERLEDLED